MDVVVTTSLEALIRKLRYHIFIYCLEMSIVTKTVHFIDIQLWLIY